VAIKKVDPNTESDKENDASMYSKPCKTENRTPKEIVKYKANNLFCLLLLKIEWWHQVTVTPEEIKSKVFNKGMFIGLKGITLRGGQICPNSKVGEILLWKKAQKKEKKNRISDKIKSNIPICKPTVTCKLWLPCLEVSEKTSRHQRKEINKIIKNEAIRVVATLALTQKTTELTKNKAENEAKIGQGLFSTMWKGWNFF